MQWIDHKVSTTCWINSKGPVQLCPSPGSAADSCPPWPYNAPGSIAYRWHSYIIDSYSIWMLATCPYGGGWLWQTWNGATALCMQENGGKNNVLLKLYHVLLLLFWLFCGTELFVHEKIEKFYLAREIRKSFFSNCMRNGNLEWVNKKGLCTVMFFIFTTDGKILIFSHF